MPDDIKEIKEKLAAIESLLQRLPEIQAVAMIQFFEEYVDAKSKGLSSKDIWIIPEPNQR